jgi:hypothetical protein
MMQRAGDTWINARYILRPPLTSSGTALLLEAPTSAAVEAAWSFRFGCLDLTEFGLHIDSAYTFDVVHIGDTSVQKLSSHIRVFECDKAKTT